MIIERLTKLDEPKRKTVAVLAVLVAACICYVVITRDSVVKLKAARANYANVQTAYASTENQLAELTNLQKKFTEKEKQLKECQQWYFSRAEAMQFFENINALALAYNLKPISRIISEPENLGDNKADQGKPKTQQQFLKTQSAKVAVSGNYSDIVNFLSELTGKPQRVSITNLHIALPPGERTNPRASFSIFVLIEAFSTTPHETKILTRNEASNITVTPNSAADRQIPAHPLTVPRNPMQFASAKTAEDETGELIVKGILYTEDSPSAIIGNKIVREGDEVSGTTIVKINEDSVEFETNGKKWVQKVQR
jgi:Tfp pilus assembly protein PilO